MSVGASVKYESGLSVVSGLAGRLSRMTPMVRTLVTVRGGSKSYPQANKFLHVEDVVPERLLRATHLRRQALEVRHVLHTLFHGAIKAGGVFGAYQGIGPAAAIGYDVNITSGPFDTLLDMRPLMLDSPKSPYFLPRIGKKLPKLAAMFAFA